MRHTGAEQEVSGNTYPSERAERRFARAQPILDL